jgi:hypothetical protein
MFYLKENVFFLSPTLEPNLLTFLKCRKSDVGAVYALYNKNEPVKREQNITAVNNM